VQPEFTPQACSYLALIVFPVAQEHTAFFSVSLSLASGCMGLYSCGGILPVERSRRHNFRTQCSSSEHSTLDLFIMDTLAMNCVNKVPISTGLSVDGHSNNWLTPHNGTANYRKCFVYPYGLRNAFAVEHRDTAYGSDKASRRRRPHDRSH
jgi:hypothetical protein